MLSEDDIAALAAGGFVLRDGLLGDAPAAAAARAAAALPGFRAAGFGRARRVDPETRGDELLWLDEPPPGLAPVVARFEELRVALNRSAFLGLERFELQLARYPGGGARYDRHRDAFAGPESRVATAIYYLNPGWTAAHGGVLRMHLPGRAPVDVEPLLDRLVVFLSAEVEHEVLPVRAPRLALTAWYRRADR